MPHCERQRAEQPSFGGNREQRTQRQERQEGKEPRRLGREPRLGHDRPPCWAARWASSSFFPARSEISPSATSARIRACNGSAAGTVSTARIFSISRSRRT